MTHDRPMYGFVANLMDELGFDNFVEGRILTVLVDFQFAYYQGIPTRWTAERWAKGLIQRLLGITPIVSGCTVMLWFTSKVQMVTLRLNMTGF